MYHAPIHTLPEVQDAGRNFFDLLDGSFVDGSFINGSFDFARFPLIELLSKCAGMGRFFKLAKSLVCSCPSI